MLPVSFPATLVAKHAFSFGTPVVVEVHPNDVRIVDEAGVVMWHSPRKLVRLSGAGMPGARNAAHSDLTLRTAEGGRRHLVFTDPRPSVFLAIATLVAAVNALAGVGLGVFGVGLIGIGLPLLTVVSLIGRAGLGGGESTPGIRQALVEAIHADGA